MVIRGLVALLFLAVFTGCSPAGSRNSPLPTSFSMVAKVKPNEETFVRAIGPAGLLSQSLFTQEELKFTAYNEVAPGTTRRVAVNWIKQISNRAPIGWKVEIIRQEAVATILSTQTVSGGISYRVAYTLELTVSVVVSPETPVGVFPFTMTISEIARPSNVGLVFFNLEVAKPE